MNNEHGKVRKGRKWIMVPPLSKVTLKDMNAVSYPSLSLCCKDIYSSFHTQSFCPVWEILQKCVYLAVKNSCCEKLEEDNMACFH